MDSVLGRRVRLRLVRQKGQSTVEFMLMIPVIFAIYFFVIEMGLYFTTVHYATYAAHAMARAQQGGYSDAYPSVNDLSKIILTGAVWTPGAAKANGPSKYELTGVAVSMNDFEVRVPFPFIRGMLPSLAWTVNVVQGPTELYYEGKNSSGLGNPGMYDNNLL